MPGTRKHPRQAHPRRNASIVATGMYLPERVLTNAELEKLVDTTDEWIQTRTGIKERRIAAEGEFTSDLGAKAALDAMHEGGIFADEIDLIIVATCTADTIFPSTACRIQQKIGAKKAAAFDIQAACSGFLYGLIVAEQFVASHVYETVLVIGAEKLSSIVNWKDRNTCVLFGDGAGAVIIRNRAEGHGILASDMGADGSQSDILSLPSSGCAIPVSEAVIQEGLQYLQMSGKEVYKHAVTAMNSSAEKTLARAGLKGSDIALVVPHQANLRIIETLAQKLKTDMDHCYVNIGRYGNMSAACIPVALHEASKEGRLKAGDNVLMVAFGGGLTWASVALEW
ncbi:3-oxoacyl-[acyl-carrier-protein] synthase III [Verrucomicrobium sp. GAS474]|uniref:beta-ketoacyl-ACP synthase III n=1 Tax=Verrucomicrobium sp. GAS474 TaxID=1882831 RepID=UPI00087A02DB|nr:beta-ketoacyl-ACP synthase III [Verrucomicrobium sp. GAS474]SDU28536.1 3-oxoacyl-[acyl-carrier-protein] synthase III [Verrucomicrobium sp. GAS474]